MSLFVAMSRTVMGLNEPPIKSVYTIGSLRCGKASGRGAESKNEWRLTSTLLYVCMALCLTYIVYHGLGLIKINTGSISILTNIYK
jgi:hypothetical protein